MEGRATFTTVASRMSMNCRQARTARAIHRRGSASRRPETGLADITDMALLLSRAAWRAEPVPGHPLTRHVDLLGCELTTDALLAPTPRGFWPAGAGGACPGSPGGTLSVL